MEIGEKRVANHVVSKMLRNVNELKRYLIVEILFSEIFSKLNLLNHETLFYKLFLRDFFKNIDLKDFS